MPRPPRAGGTSVFVPPSTGAAAAATSAAGAVAPSASSKSVNNNLLLKCVQCRRPVEILAPSGAAAAAAAAATSLSAAAAGSPPVPFAEQMSRALLSCALSTSQDLPLCSSCWSQKLAGAQQSAVQELSSLVETLSTVRDISPAAIAAFKDFVVDLDDLSQQYVVLPPPPPPSSSSAAADAGLGSPMSPCRAAAAALAAEDEALAARLDDEHFEAERAELERELQDTEQALAARRREVKALQAALAALNAQADGVERQLNAAALQESAVESAAASAASRLQTAKAGFARLGLTVTDIARPPAAAAAAGAAGNGSEQQQQRPAVVVVDGSAMSTGTTPKSENDAAGGASGAAHSGNDDGAPATPTRGGTKTTTTATATTQVVNGTVVEAGTVAGSAVVSGSVESLVAAPTVALFSVTPSQVRFEAMNNVSATSNLSSVLSAAFHIEFDDQIGRINHRRVGRLSTIPVTDDEINAGCGFLSLLMNYLLNSYTRMERTMCSMDPQGCASAITIYSQANPQKRVVVDFHIKRRIFSWSTFGQAWVTFALCTREVVLAITSALRAKAQRLRGTASFAASASSTAAAASVPATTGSAPGAAVAAAAAATVHVEANGNANGGGGSNSSSAQMAVRRIEEHIALLTRLPKISQNGLKVDEDSVKYGDASDQQWTAAVRGIMRLLLWSILADRLVTE